jgi:hypothetical protein
LRSKYWPRFVLGLIPVLPALMLVELPVHADISTQLTAENPEKSDFSTDLELHSSQYLDAGQPYFRSGAAANDQSFLFRTQGDHTGRSGLSGKWDIETEYSATENWNYFRPHEGYLSYDGFSLGRKKLTWSQWEEPWGQSLVQPRFMDDKLNNTQAGLIGLFYEHEGTYVNVRAVFAPIYLPDMGPHYWLAGQHLVSKNPWFSPPQTSFIYQGANTNINYNVDQPNDFDVINRPGGGAMIEWKPSEMMFSRLSWAFLPMTQILFGFPLNGKFNVTTLSMDLDLTPRFLYHNVVNYDLVVKGTNSEFGLSVADDLPIQDHMAGLPDWEVQNTTNAIIASAYGTYFLNENKSADLTGSLLKIWGGDQPDSGPVETTLTLFERRYQYTEALSVGARKRWHAQGVPGVESGLKMVYDRLENGMVYSGDFTAYLQRSLALTLAYDYFTLLPGTPQMPDGFINVYRGNDRLSMGVRYVF